MTEYEPQYTEARLKELAGIIRSKKAKLNRAQNVIEALKNVKSDKMKWEEESFGTSVPSRLIESIETEEEILERELEGVLEEIL